MKKAAVAIVLCAIAVAMSVAQGVSQRPIFGDDQLYFFMAERCASGVPPHVSQLEVKTQLPTLIGGATIAVGRRFGIDDVHAGRIATVAAAAAASVFGWLLALELTASQGAALVAAAAIFSIYGLFLEAAIGFQPKLPMIPFLLAAHLWCAQRKAWRTGIAGACAFLCWQPAGLVLGSCGLAALLDRRATWAHVARMVAGAVVVFALYEAWFAWHGALAAQLHQEVVLAFDSSHKPIDWAESFWFVLTEAQTFRPRPDGLPSVAFAAAALLWLGMLLAPRRAWTTLRERPGLVAFWTAAHIAVAFTLFDHQAHPDMLLPQPYFAVACGIAFGWLACVLGRLPGGKVLAKIAAAIFVACGLWDARGDVRRASGGQTGLETQLAMGRLTSLYLDHRGSVWALGSVHLLGFLHQDNWTPVGNVGHETAELDMKTYRPLRDGRMPEIIIAGRGYRPGFNTWLPTEYVDITPAAFAVDRIRVFSRRSPDQPGFERGTAPRPAPNPRPIRRPQAKPPAAATGNPPPARPIAGQPRALGPDAAGARPTSPPVATRP